MKNIAIRKVVNMNIERDEIYQVVSSKSECKEARNESIPFKSDIRNALQHSNLEDQAIILLISSSGMDYEQICKLTFGNFYDAICVYMGDEEFDIVRIAEILDYRENITRENITGTWYVKRQKTGNEYYTFSTTESIKAIIDYLMERQEKNGIIKSRGEVLFENFGGKIPENSFIAHFFQMINNEEGAGLSGKPQNFQFHSLRKYFASKLYKNGLSQIDIDWFLGNGTDYPGDTFFLKEEYLKVVEDLSIENFKVQGRTTEAFNDLLVELQHEKISMKKMQTRMEIIENKLLVINELQKDISALL